MIGRLVLFVATLANAAVFAVPPAKTAANSLSRADKKLLNQLVDKFLIDPRGAKRVKVLVTIRIAGARSSARLGWLKKSASSGSRVYFADGDFEQADESVEPIDYLANCRKRLSGQIVTARAQQRSFRGRSFGRTWKRRDILTELDNSPLIHAAWLCKLGQNQLAAKLLKRARSQANGNDKQMVASLRKQLAGALFAKLASAYQVKADRAAIFAGGRLQRLYSNEVKQYHPQSTVILAALAKRKREKRLGQSLPITPKGFATWKPERHIAHLIRTLEDANPIRGDRRISELVKLGDAAVPILIDTIESDPRLTRSVTPQSFFEEWRPKVITVRQAAMTAVQEIIQVRAFDQVSAAGGVDLTPTTAPQVAKRLRVYWKEFGHLPFPARMMKVLVNPKSHPEMLREAVQELAQITRRIDRSNSSSPIRGPRRLPKSLAKFSNPTVAQAVLLAMDRDLGSHKKKRSAYVAARRQIRTRYLDLIVRLGDRRIVGELTRRYRSATGLASRRMLAHSASQLGSKTAIKHFAKDVETGNLKLPKNAPNRPGAYQGTVALGEIIFDLTIADVPEADRALYAIAKKSHPYYKLTSSQLKTGFNGFSDDQIWFSHPYCLQILRQQLNDKTKTGGVYRADEDSITYTLGDGTDYETLPPCLANPKQRRNRVTERAYDSAGIALCELILGLPYYHPLQKRSEQNLKDLKQALDRSNGFRRITKLEAKFLYQEFNNTPWFVPRFTPLGRPATEDDVKKGRAIFSLTGKRTVARLQLPAAGWLGEERVLIVQAEVTDGKTFYGAIGTRFMRKVEASKVTKVVTIK